MGSFEQRCKRRKDCRFKENFVPLALQLHQPDLLAKLCGYGLIALAEMGGVTAAWLPTIMVTLA
jgi:hypothetical protein